MRLIDIARQPKSGPETDDSTPRGGVQPTADVDKGSALVPKVDEKPKDGPVATADSDKKDDQKGKDADTDASDPAKAKKDDAPGEFKVTAPDGVKVDEAQLKEFSGWAKKEGLTAEQASKLVAYQVQANKAAEAAWRAEDTKNGEALKSDKDFGGKNYDASVAAAQKAVLKFGGKELADELDRLGIGNNPHLARAFAKIGKAIGEDSAAVDTARPGSEGKPGDAKQRLSKMYDSPDSKQARGAK